MRAVRAVVVSLIAGSFLAAGALPSAAQSPQRVYVAALLCTGHAMKPRMIFITCGDGNFFAAHLRYTRYGGRTARATGQLVDNNCRPDCAAGKLVSYPGTITLSEIRPCHGRLYYDRISWRFLRGPYPNGHQNIRPDACSPA
jgi:hypothetical protein